MKALRILFTSALLLGAVSAIELLRTDASAYGQDAKTLPVLTTVPAFPNLDFRRPIAMVTLGKGENERVYVAEQFGTIWTFPNKPNVTKAEKTKFFQFEVNHRDNEEGLLGMAFHPDFANNRQVFLYYSAMNPQRRSIVSRFKVKADDRNVIDPKSEEVIWTSDVDPFGNHNGGCIEFGPSDGYLYISLGDSGAAGDPKISGQNPKDFWGSLMRLDVDHPANGKPYGIPADNPARGSAKHKHWAPEVYCIGLRNVWKFTFDRQAPHTLWAGDVGQDLFEIVHIIENGGNYGWSVMEGTHPFQPRFRQPRDPAVPLSKAIVDYPHSVGKSISGGYVYRGSAIPELQGAYVYGDYDSGRIWGLRYDANKKSLIVNKELTNFAKERRLRIIGFGQDAAGELYILSDDGKIYRLQAAKAKA